jgi:hypothetical protein
MTYDPTGFARPSLADALDAHRRLEKVELEDHDEDGTFNLDYVPQEKQQEVQTAIQTLKRYGIDDNNGKVSKRNLTQLRRNNVGVSDISGNPHQEDVHPSEHSGVEFQVGERLLRVDDIIVGQ